MSKIQFMAPEPACGQAGRDVPIAPSQSAARTHPCAGAVGTPGPARFRIVRQGQPPVFLGRWVAVFLGFALLGASAPRANAAELFLELFDNGNQAYAAGGYNQAAELFQKAAALAPASGVLHNLGNAEYMAGRLGPAILAWERAHWLAPYFDNTKANLRFARKKAQLDEPDLAWYEICSTWLPSSAWPWIAGFSLWLAVGMVLLPGIFHWRKSDWHQGLAASGFAVFLLTLPAILGVQSRSELGVVLEKETRLRLTPTQDAQILTRLSAGEIGRVQRRRDHYYYIRLGSDAAGWVDRKHFHLICGP